MQSIPPRPRKSLGNRFRSGGRASWGTIGAARHVRCSTRAGWSVPWVRGDRFIADGTLRRPRRVAFEWITTDDAPGGGRAEAVGACAPTAPLLSGECVPYGTRVHAFTR